MEKMNLKEIQTISLDILKDVHDFCVKNGIRYSLAYGTLIGAIRHKGFIPWDEDVDLFMPRPDYERFCKSYQSPLFKLISSYDENSYIAFSRVCEMDKTLVKDYVPWCTIPTGVWIDIFPLDGAEDNKEEFDKRYAKANKYWWLLYRNRGAKNIFSSEYSFKEIIKLLLKKILYFNGINLKKNLKKFNAVIQQYKFEECEHWGQLSCCDNGSNEYNLTSDFNELILVDFEQFKFYSLKNYDKVLRSEYGNYMQLPPEKDRKPKQTIMHFYWKTK